MHTFKYLYAIRIPLIVGELEKKNQVNNYHNITDNTRDDGFFSKMCIPIQISLLSSPSFTLIPSHPSKFTQIRKTNKRQNHNVEQMMRAIPDASRITTAENINYLLVNTSNQLILLTNDQQYRTIIELIRHIFSITRYPFKPDRVLKSYASH